MLLVKRARAPRAGEWSLPGGKVEWGESLHAAALRELAEETGVEARITSLIDVVDAILPDGERHYVLIDFAARWTAGETRPGSDAAEARWFSLEDACAAVSWEETRRIIRKSIELI